MDAIDMVLEEVGGTLAVYLDGRVEYPNAKGEWVPVPPEILERWKPDFSADIEAARRAGLPRNVIGRARFV